MQSGRQDLVFERQGGLDQTGDAGSGVEMADIGLDRPQRAVARARRLSAKNSSQRGELDRVAEGSGGAVRLDIRDRIGGHAGEGLGGADDGGLASDRGSGEASLGGTIVVDRRATDDGVDRILGRQRIVQTLEHHHADAAAEDRAARLGIEGPAVAVGREDTALLVQIAGVLRHADRDPAGQHHVTLATQQALAAKMDRDQRGRAGGLDCHARSRQVQLVCNVRGKIVFIIAGSELHGAY